MELKELEAKITKQVEHLKDELGGIQAERVSAILLKNIRAKFPDGRENSIIEIAAIRNVTNRTLAIKPYNKEDSKIIEKTLALSDLGIHPSTKDEEIWLIFPDMNQEARQALIKKITQYAEDSKHAIRGFRHDFLKQNEKNTKEEKIRQEKEVQKLIDKSNEQIKEIETKKAKDILGK